MKKSTDAERREALREGMTMALYISLSLIAVMVAVPHPEDMASGDLAWLTFVTSVGLILAHQLAFRMSSRLFADGSRLEAMHVLVLRDQLVGGGLVTAIAIAPIILLGTGAFRLSVLILLAFVLTVGYFVARSAPTSRPRALAYVTGVGILVVAVLAVKSLAGH